MHSPEYLSLSKRIIQFNHELSFTKKLILRSSIQRASLSEEQKRNLLEQYYEHIETGTATSNSSFVFNEKTGLVPAKDLSSSDQRENSNVGSNVQQQSNVAPISFLEKLRLKKLAAADKEEFAPEPAHASPEPKEVEATETTVVPAGEVILGTASEVLTKEAKAIAEIETAAAGKAEQFSLNIQLNERQLAAKELAFQGKSFVLIGPAGSGKTTCQRAVAEALLESNQLSESKFKKGNGPSIAFVAYTRRAARNLEKAIHKVPILKEKLAVNCMTIHALLEFEPVSYWDETEQRETFRFLPQRTADNPLDITHLVIEEASMLGLDLWKLLWDALPYGIQIIFIGDINQLPPVFGPSILNYAMMQLPIIELVETYRNQGVVLDNAHRILKGQMVECDENYKIASGKQGVAHGQAVMARQLGGVFKVLSQTTDADGNLEYDPEDCMILSPFNKQDLGTDNMNKYIAQFLGDQRKAVVHEVLAGFHTHYLAIGDKVMYNKRDAIITDIYPNSKYTGKIPQIPGTDLLRFGARKIGAGNAADLLEAISEGEAKAAAISIDYSNFSLEDEKIDRVQQASSIVNIQYDGSEEVAELSSAGDFQPAVFSLGYVLTVHKAQGSEWRKVYIILHKDHATMNYRELIYTAATRARTKVTFITFPHLLQKGIENPRIKGNTLAAKLEYFNSGIKEIDTSISCTK